MQDSGHDRAQRGQNPGITQNRAYIVDLRSFLRFPGAAAPLQATKAKNQRSRNSYAGFWPLRSPARPKPWYNFCMGSQICQLHLVTLFNLAPNCEDACNTVLRMP